jgi:two-component system CheB/CheR fusion protein
MRNLIDDLLNFSRISRFEKKIIVTDLNKVLKDVLTDFDLLVQEKNAVFHIDKLPVIEAIPLHMNQLFHNLLSNALKFIPPNVNPVVTITCRRLQKSDLGKYPRLDPALNYYEIAIKDNGIGFPQEFADQIFVIFQRLNDKDEYPGTGIGLALCRKIISNHYGYIYPESKENEGATFYVIIPAKQPQNVENTKGLD